MSEGTVTVTVNGVPGEYAAGTLLSSVLPDFGLFSLPCGGRGRCGKCRVTASGELSPPTGAESRILTPDELARGVRLACQTKALGPACVTFDGGREEKARILTDGILPSFDLDPVFGGNGIGAAVDIGTTTLAVRLYGRDGKLLREGTRLNPQSSFGADVVSRMEAAMAGHAGELKSAVLGAVDGMLASLSPVPPSAVAVTGNSAMLHLLTGTDVTSLTRAPFRAARLFGEYTTAGDLGLSVPAPGAPVLLPPAIASFVGADTATAMLACGFADEGNGGTALLADIGTNGEIVLRRNGRLYACSTAAGPAFEGAGISMGMGGETGAVDHVSLGPDGKIAAHVIGDAAPAGICGSGLIDAVACLLENEDLDETGFLEDDPAVILPPVELTQNDIRAVQLAKGAIHAGIRTLLRISGTPVGEVETFYVAGGFGSFLDVGSACRIGLLPAELRPAVRVVGNAALSGCSMLLLGRGLFAPCLAMARRTEHVELASSPVFTEEYMERMLF